MKLVRFASPLLCVGVVLLLTSCGGGSNEKTSAADSTAAADSAAKARAANTIVTTPENIEIVTHKVADYAKWLVGYEAHDSARLADGLHNYVIGRGIQDSNMVMVAMKVDDTTKAKAFAKDPSVKARMVKAGVIGAPTISIITATWQDTAKIETTLRSQTTMMAKDWDTFLKGFEDGKQERMDNGIIDRVISHDLNDNKKVSIVTAITDTAKAYAYYKSDALKKRREAGGVIGEPVRFLFQIVKRY